MGEAKKEPVTVPKIEELSLKEQAKVIGFHDFCERFGILFLILFCFYFLVTKG